MKLTKNTPVLRNALPFTKAKFSMCLMAGVLFPILVGSIACSKALTDSQIASAIENRLNADSGLKGKQLVVQAANGTVTLSGTVDDDAQRDAAARYASSEAGVKQVVNNLQVHSQSPQTVQVQPPVQKKPEPPLISKRHRKHHLNNSAAAIAVKPEVARPAPAPETTPVPMKSTIRDIILFYRDGFDFNRKMNRSLVFDLATGTFIARHEDTPCFLGHLAPASANS